MKPKNTSLGDDQNRFYTTRWSLVLLSARIQAPDFQKARGELFEISHQKTATFEELKAFLDHLKIEDLPSDGQAATAFQVSVGAVRTLIHRLSKEYATLVHQEIGPTGSSAADINTGIHELCEALMKEGWSVL